MSSDEVIQFKPTRPYPGLFVAAEGGEGSGKTTHIGLLGEALRSKGFDVVVTKEPGAPESGICQDIRAMLLRPRTEALSPMAELLLFHADRAQHLAHSVRPALERGAIVLCDRFSGSTLAYQGARGHDRDVLVSLGHLVQNGLHPDLTFFFDPGEEEAHRRMNWRNQETGNQETRFDNEALTFHQDVWQRYRKLYTNPDGSPSHESVVLVNSSGSITDTHDRVVTRMQEVLLDLNIQGAAHV